MHSVQRPCHAKLSICPVPIPCSNSNLISAKCGALCHDPCNTVTYSHSVFPKTSGFHNCVKTVSKDVSNRVFICQQLLYTSLRSKNHSTHELDISIAPAILLCGAKKKIVLVNGGPLVNEYNNKLSPNLHEKNCSKIKAQKCPFSIS